jgi:hypothetical protein
VRGRPGGGLGGTQINLNLQDGRPAAPAARGGPRAGQPPMPGPRAPCPPAPASTVAARPARGRYRAPAWVPNSGRTRPPGGETHQREGGRRGQQRSAGGGALRQLRHAVGCGAGEACQLSLGRLLPAPGTPRAVTPPAPHALHQGGAHAQRAHTGQRCRAWPFGRRHAPRGAATGLADARAATVRRAAARGRTATARLWVVATAICAFCGVGRYATWTRDARRHATRNSRCVSAV